MDHLFVGGSVTICGPIPKQLTTKLDYKSDPCMIPMRRS